MDYGRVFMELAYEAVEREERELKKLRSDKYADVMSVWQFEEAWLQYVIVKHAIREGIYKKLNAEFACGKKRVDLCFVDDNGHVLAMFELKPGKPSSQIAQDIVSDCEKLRGLGNSHADAQKYVLGLLCGLPSEIRAWEETLSQNLHKSKVMTERVSSPHSDIPSNEGKVFKFVMLRVVTAAAMKARA